jgi:hypothetical protein
LGWQSRNPMREADRDSRLGDTAELVAAVVKMIRNIPIGVVPFCVAVAWVTAVDRDSAGALPSAMEIGYRFAKIIVGFAAASLVFSHILIPAFGGGQVGTREAEKDVIRAATPTCRGCSAWRSWRSDWRATSAS